MVSEVKCFCDFNLEFCLASSSNTSQKHQNKGKIMFQFYSIEVNREYVVDSELVSDFGYHWCFLKEKGFLKTLGNEYYAQKDKRKCPVSTQMLSVCGSLYLLVAYLLLPWDHTSGRRELTTPSCQSWTFQVCVGATSMNATSTYSFDFDFQSRNSQFYFFFNFFNSLVTK